MAAAPKIDEGYLSMVDNAIDAARREVDAIKSEAERVEAARIAKAREDFLTSTPEGQNFTAKIWYDCIILHSGAHQKHIEMLVAVRERVQRGERPSLGAVIEASLLESHLCSLESC